MNSHDDQFTPEMVDEQIEQALQAREHVDTAAARTVEGLRNLYGQDADSMMQVWQRLSTHITEMERKELPGVFLPIQEKRSHTMKQDETVHPKRIGRQRQALVLSGLAAAVVVASLLAVFAWARHGGSQTGAHSSTQQVATPSGIYIAASDGVRRLDKNTGKALWHYTLTDAPRVVKSGEVGYELNCTLTIDGDIVYVASTYGTLYAIDANSGTLRWSRILNHDGIHTPGVLNGLVYVAGYGAIYVVNTADGQLEKTYQPVGLGNDFALATLTENALYVTSYATGIYALAPTDGHQLWHQSVSQDQAVQDMQVVNGVLYAVSSKINKVKSADEPQDSYVYAFDTATGTKLWQSQMMNGFVFHATVANGAVYCGSQNRFVYAYDARTGNELWRKNVGGFVAAAPAVDGGIVYVNVGMLSGNPTPGVVALNAKNGNILRQLDQSVGGADFTPPVVQNGTIYAISSDAIQEARIFALHPDGSIVWQMPAGINPKSLVVKP